MRQVKFLFLLGAILVMSLSFAGKACADKASVTVDVPESAANGSEITIKITVSHNADNFIHHVNWAYIMVNGKEVERWKFKWNDLPPASTFTKEIKYKMEGPAEIKADANCNIHGSKGAVIKTITLK